MVDFAPRDPARVTFYSCGPTVYDDAHIGNFRSFLAADVLRRWIESPMCEVRNADGSIHHGPRIVRQVMNITDVGHMTEDDIADGGGEDKMEAAARRLAEAKKAGTHHEGEDVDPNDPFAIARFYETRFRQDARKLGLRVAIDAETDATVMPRATDNVGGMIEMIERLIERGHAYTIGEAGNQTVYFDVRSFDDYGQLSGNTLDKVREGAGGRLSDADQRGKRNAADFLLWKTDRGHLMKWDSPWGTGYPGWHIECSVMSLDGLCRGEEPREIDLHSGGEDNIFPHHECEIAQSRCATGAERFSRYWFHARFLMLEGEKMSKSKGNFFTPRDLMAKGHEPAAVRLELIRTHYRTNANFTVQGLKDSARQVKRWRRFVEDSGATHPASNDSLPETDVAKEFAAAMHDDLNIAGAIGAINKWINTIQSPSKAEGETFLALDQTIGLLALYNPATMAAINNVDWESETEAKITEIEGHIQAQSRVQGGIQISSPVLVPEDANTRPEISFEGIEATPEATGLIVYRFHAKRQKKYDAADDARVRLQKLGYKIKDSADGKVVASRL